MQRKKEYCLIAPPPPPPPPSRWSSSSQPPPRPSSTRRGACTDKTSKLHAGAERADLNLIQRGVRYSLGGRARFSLKGCLNSPPASGASRCWNHATFWKEVFSAEYRYNWVEWWNKPFQQKNLRFANPISSETPPLHTEEEEIFTVSLSQSDDRKLQQHVGNN